MHVYSDIKDARVNSLREHSETNSFPISSEVETLRVNLEMHI